MYIYSKTRHKELSEDLCQNTFIRFYEALSRYEYREDEGGLLPYLFVIAKRLLINEGEKKSYIAVDEIFFEGESDGTPDTLSVTHIKHMAHSVEETFSSLTPLEEDVVRLYFYSELSHKEIAQVLEREESYIRKIKERALRKIREATKHLQ